jgi:superfamily II DNA or RNA helicase
MNVSLGSKGYTILKSELTISKQITIKQELTVRPFTLNNSNTEENEFFVYRENDKKLYVPHYYGVKKFGQPKLISLSEGDNINPDISFHGQLRDYQAPVVQKYINHVETAKFGGGLLELPCGWGKTSASLYIFSQLRKKTLVIVHQEFLMNQWIERIHQFLPLASIGKIQRDIIDIENKDIVLCMLQSLVIKHYDPSIFSSFGFTIIDEVHHISSRSFSNSLFKVVTKYMLGLSATMERKDKTTNIFKMFLGEVIFKAEQRKEYDVEVRALTYHDENDSEFNKTILDWKGNAQNSSMISKLCTHNDRTEFIIKALCDFIRVDNVELNIIKTHKLNMDASVPCCAICNKNNNYLVLNSCCNLVKYCMICTENNGKKCPDCGKVWKVEQKYIENPYVKPLEQRHTIVMSHNLNILRYIYNKIICKNLASVGFYVGGMNESELKKSEKKQIILATFSMTQEGLDIPSLNAEFLITPKTDITQCVGRILRAKHAFFSPVIYDFVDIHDLFKRQWLKRKAFYKKNNYTIVGSTNKKYNSENIVWQPIYYPNKNKIDSISRETADINDSDDDSNEDNSSRKCVLFTKK